MYIYIYLPRYIYIYLGKLFITHCLTSYVLSNSLFHITYASHIMVKPQFNTGRQPHTHTAFA